MAEARKTRIGLIGAGGRMGLAITEVVTRETAARTEIALRVDRDDKVDLAKHAASCDVLLDVSVPQAAESFIQELVRGQTSVPYVIGCTGWTEHQLKAVHAYAKQAPVVLAPNFSPGVNLFLGLIEQAAPLLAKWGYDVSVHETHHTKKLDSPSGTAKAIVERLGHVKAQVHATRAGNVVGTHEVRFVGPGDVLKIEHEALDRMIFARGAVMAAEWAAAQKSPGLYSMKQVIFGSD